MGNSIPTGTMKDGAFSSDRPWIGPRRGEVLANRIVGLCVEVGVGGQYSRQDPLQEFV
jgi:hypothetical protein